MKNVNKVGHFLNDPDKLKNFGQRNKKELILWSVLAVILVLAYMFLSSGDFSFLLTLAASIQMFGFLLILLHIIIKKTSMGLSAHTFVCYGIAMGARLTCHLLFDGYLPYDKTGDHFLKGVEGSSFIICLNQVRAIYLLIPTLILAFLFHSNLNNNYISDVTWAFAEYLESLSMFPLIYVMHQQKGREVDPLTSHFVASQALSRLVSVIFWISSFQELNIDVTSSQNNTYTLLPGYVGYIILLAQIGQMALLSDFMWLYYQSIKEGRNVAFDIV